VYDGIPYQVKQRAGDRGVTAENTEKSQHTDFNEDTTISDQQFLRFCADRHTDRRRQKQYLIYRYILVPYQNSISVHWHREREKTDPVKQQNRSTRFFRLRMRSRLMMDGNTSSMVAVLNTTRMAHYNHSR